MIDETEAMWRRVADKALHERLESLKPQPMPPHPRRALTQEQAREIRAGMPYVHGQLARVAEQYHCGISIVWGIVKGITYREKP